MARLTLKFKDLVLQEFEFPGGSKTIGREPGNDIVLENLLVSSHHARIDKTGKDYILTDLQSKNGTYVNGERVTSSRLQDGDEIVIGKHTLVFHLDKAEAAEGRELTEATMFIEVARGEKPPPPRAAATSGETTGLVPPVERLGVLSFLAGGPGEDYELTKKLVKIGKGQEADIQVGGLLTPRVAATISRRPTGYHLTAVGGRAKVKVNGTAITGSYRLKEFDTIEVGPARMQFYYKN